MWLKRMYYPKINPQLSPDYVIVHDVDDEMKAGENDNNQTSISWANPVDNNPVGEEVETPESNEANNANDDQFMPVSTSRHGRVI